MIVRRIAPLCLVGLLAAACGDNEKSSSATTTSSTTTSTVSTGPSGTTPIPALPSSPGNKLLLGKRDLYPLLGADLSKYVPGRVRGTSVTVIQPAGIDSFWAGRDAKQRILVKLELDGSSPPRLKAGQQASFVGQLAKAAEASRLGVKDKTGGPVLENQGVYVVVRVGDLKLK